MKTGRARLPYSSCRKGYWINEILEMEMEKVKKVAEEVDEVNL
jgi:hypothetical protein